MLQGGRLAVAQGAPSVVARAHFLMPDFQRSVSVAVTVAVAVAVSVAVSVKSVSVQAVYAVAAGACVPQ